MLKAALCGNYVNFGVFRLYGDDALDNVLNCFVKLLLSIPLSDLMVSELTYNCTITKIQQIDIYFIRCAFPGLSEIVAHLLRIIRVYSTRSYEFSGFFGSQHVSLHSIFDFRRASRLGYIYNRFLKANNDYN